MECDVVVCCWQEPPFRVSGIRGDIIYRVLSDLSWLFFSPKLSPQQIYRALLRR